MQINTVEQFSLKCYLNRP